MPLESVVPVPTSRTRVPPVAEVSGTVRVAVRSPAYQGEKPTVTVHVPSDVTTAPLQPSLTTSNSGKSSGLVGTVTLAAPKDTGTCR